jgi:hypothetical protein
MTIDTIRAKLQNANTGWNAWMLIAYTYILYAFRLTVPPVTRIREDVPKGTFVLQGRVIIITNFRITQILIIS